MSPEGNERPTSTIRIRSSSSTQAMLRPTSPTPPRKTTFTRAAPAASEETGILQGLVDAVALLGGGRHERQTRWPGRATDHLEGGLHRDRVRGHEEGVVQRAERLVDLASGRHVAGLD